MDTYVRQAPWLSILLISLLVGAAFVCFLTCGLRRRLHVREVVYAFVASTYTIMLISVYAFPPALPFSLEGWDASISSSAIFQFAPLKTIFSADPSSVFASAAAFIPLPILLSWHLSSIIRTGLLSVCIVSLIEPLQLALNYLSGIPRYVIDIDDFILALFGVVIGMLLNICFRAWMDERRWGDAEKPV